MLRQRRSLLLASLAEVITIALYLEELSKQIIDEAMKIKVEIESARATEEEGDEQREDKEK